MLKSLKKVISCTLNETELLMLGCIAEPGTGNKAKSRSATMADLVAAAFDERFPGVLDELDRRKHEAMTEVEADPASESLGVVEKRQRMGEAGAKAVIDGLEDLHRKLFLEMDGFQAADQAARDRWEADCKATGHRSEDALDVAREHELFRFLGWSA